MSSPKETPGKTIATHIAKKIFLRSTYLLYIKCVTLQKKKDREEDEYMSHLVPYWCFRRTQYIASIGFNYNVWGFYLEGVWLWGLVGITYSEWMCHLGNNLLPVQRVIRTFLEKRLLRLVQPFPRSCMDKQNQMHTKMHTNWERHSASLANAGFANIVPRVRIPLPPPHPLFHPILNSPTNK